MTDDQMDEMLIQGVRDYNAPGATPRDEMWKGIAEARAANAKAARPATALPSRRYFWPSVGVAAALILSVGIAIGRRMNDGRSPVSANPASTVAVIPLVKPNQESTTTAPAASVRTRDSLIHELHEQTNSTGRRVRDLAEVNPSAPRAGNSTAATRTNESLAYRLVVLQHLAGSEAMITSFRSSAKAGEMDAQLSGWAKDLLSTTRLLESSQAGTDPVMKRLLVDLDLVISEIVQYTTRGISDPDELDLIEQSINKRGVMSKLRSTIPSRATAGL